MHACSGTKRHVQFFATPWTVASRLLCPWILQARILEWNGVLSLLPGDLLDSGIKPESPASPALQADSLPLEPSGKPGRGLIGVN